MNSGVLNELIYFLKKDFFDMPTRRLARVYEAMIYNAKKEAELWQKLHK